VHRAKVFYQGLGWRLDVGFPFVLQSLPWMVALATPLTPNPDGPAMGTS